MTVRTTRAAASMTALLLGAVLVLGSAATFGVLAVTASPRAGASTAPPWEPDPHSVGGLIFFNASGDVITSGSTSDSPIAAYVEGTTIVNSKDDRATLFGYLPVEGEAPGQWSGDQFGASTTYPPTDAPAALESTDLPVATGANGNETVAQLEADYPNDDTSNDGYAGIYQVRVLTSGTDVVGNTTYDSADIEVTGDTWSVVYSAGQTVTTTTSLAVSPSPTTEFGATVRLTATVTPSDAVGTVTFHDGTTRLGAAAVSGGRAVLSTAALSGGTDRLTATFAATDSNAFTTSTSSVHVLTVKAHPTSTSLKASKATVKKGAKVTLTADVSPVAVGHVVFYDGSIKLATVAVSTKGAAVYATTTLPVGTDSLKAVFEPTHGNDDETSTSKIVKVRVTR